MKEKTCAIPWKSLYIHSDGSIFPCCIVFKDLGKFNHTDIKEAWNSSIMKNLRQSHALGEEYSACKSCWNRENKGLSSRRNSFFVDLEEANLPTVFETKDTVSLNEITHFDISFGNECNLNCAFCSPDKSSKWEQLTKSLPDGDVFDFYRSRNKNISPIDHNKLIDTVLSLESLRIIEIKGGEPFVAKGNEKLLRALIKANRAQDITLWYSSNLTIVPDYLYQLLPEFKSVHISISLDGIGETQIKIRGKNASFEKHILPNIKKLQQLPSTSLSTHTTVCAYNFPHLDTLLNTLHSDEVNVKSNAFGIVRKPDFLSPFVINQNDASIIIENYCNSQFKKLKKFASSLKLSDFNDSIISEEFNEFDKYWNSIG